MLDTLILLVLAHFENMIRIFARECCDHYGDHNTL